MGEILDEISEMASRMIMLAHVPLVQEMARIEEEKVRKRTQQEFLDLVLEAGETGDKSKLAAWWRERYPGYKWWCFGPSFQAILPDDGKNECSL